MRIAFLFDWHCNMQRPHHWVIQAVKHGHEADVYTPGRFRWRRLQVPYEYASRVFIIKPSIVESVLIRLCRLVGCRDSVWSRSRNQRRYRIWEAVWNGETKEKYDAVVYCGRVHCIVHRSNNAIPLVYDCMDEWDGFSGAHPRSLEFEDSLARVADIIWAVTPYLAERLARKHGTEKCHVIPNGCDCDHFSKAKEEMHPSTWKSDTPIIGYAGNVSTWFDWDAVTAVATSRPDAIIWIIGSCHTQVPQNLPRNIVLEGFVPYEKLPAYYAGFDVSIIPFKGDLLLKGVSPIKLYEYLAAGKPVVCSPMPDAVHLAERGVAEVATSPEQFARICFNLVDQANDEALIQKRRDLARSHSWTARWETCENLIRAFDVSRANCGDRIS